MSSEAQEPKKMGAEEPGNKEPAVGGQQSVVIKGRRFYGTVELNATRIGRDAGQIAEAIVQHLTTLPNAKVTITLEIHADLPEGASDHIIRTVTENAHTLKFQTFGFEEA